jgi:hypothetical protein
MRSGSIIEGQANRRPYIREKNKRMERGGERNGKGREGKKIEQPLSPPPIVLIIIIIMIIIIIIAVVSCEGEVVRFSE